VLIMGKRINFPSSFNVDPNNSIPRGTPPPAYADVENQHPQTVANLSLDQMTVLASYLSNAVTISDSEQSVVEQNFKDLQDRFSCSKGYRTESSFTLSSAYPDLCLHVRSADIEENNNYLPIKESRCLGTIDLSSPIPPTLQKAYRVRSISDLIKQQFPQLAGSIQGQKISKFVFSVPIPLDRENKGSFFPEIVVPSGYIAYLAWDSSGLQLSQGFKEGFCEILLEDSKAFCGTALSQQNLQGIEKGAGVSGYFMSTKVTVMGIFIPKSSEVNSSRIESSFYDREVLIDGAFAAEPSQGPLRSRGASGSSYTPFGMLGIQGARVDSSRMDVSDKHIRIDEKPLIFCLEIVPQFSSRENPVTDEDLEVAIEIQYQEQMLNMYQFKA
jgi:hypothetical protein